MARIWLKVASATFTLRFPLTWYIDEEKFTAIYLNNLYIIKVSTSLPLSSLPLLSNTHAFLSHPAFLPAVSLRLYTTWLNRILILQLSVDFSKCSNISPSVCPDPDSCAIETDAFPHLQVSQSSNQGEDARSCSRFPCVEILIMQKLEITATKILISLKPIPNLQKKFLRLGLRFFN